MNKFWVALLTFAIGIFAFGLFSFKSSFIIETQEVSLNETPVSTITPFTQTSLDVPQKVATENLQPFFKSFKDDEGYWGWLIADDFKGMKEVWTILLTRDSENLKSEKLVWNAMVLRNDIDYNTIDDDDFDFSSIWIKIKNNKLSFKTKKYHNVEYKFSGEFFKSGKDFAEKEKVLKGTMQKFVRGKKVAEFTADFAYFEPQCFH